MGAPMGNRGMMPPNARMTGNLPMQQQFGQGPQQAAPTSGLAPWLRQSQMPPRPMPAPRQLGQGTMTAPGRQTAPGLQSAPGQQEVLAKQQALAQQLRSDGAAQLQQKQQAEQAAAGIYDQALQQHKTMGGVRPELYSQLDQAQRLRLQQDAMANPYMSPYAFDSGGSAVF